MEYYGSTSSTVLLTQTTRWKSLKVVLTNSWINWLLILIPFGYLKWSDTWVFVLNFLALIPFAKLFMFAIENISLQVDKVQVDKTFGFLLFLLKVIFGNAVGIIVIIVALKDGQIHIGLLSIFGSIILNLLLVLLVSFVIEIAHGIQRFKNLILTILVCGSLGIPAAFIFAVESIDGQLSHIMTTVVLIFVILYCFYYFQVSTLDLYHERRRPQLSIVESFFLLAALVVIVAFSVENLINSIEGSGLNKNFVSFILLPIIYDDATFVTAAISKIFSTPGGSMQTTIIVTVFIVLGWKAVLYFNLSRLLKITIGAFFIAGFLIYKHTSQKLKENILCSNSLPSNIRDVTY